MSDNTKKYLISSARVFISAFLPIIISTFASGTTSWTLDFWLPVLIAAISAGFKAVSDPQIPPKLGGTKGL